ncbi:MAG: hypothetical protein HYX41_01420 [Bdellovibrio sp.]|nr:hypothetical protein [Bdellovibrio sp.]
MYARKFAQTLLGGVIACVFCFPLAHAGGRLIVQPELGFFSLSGVDTETTADAVVSTIYNWGLSFTWLQGMTNKAEGFIKVGARAYGLNSPGSAKVLNPNQDTVDFAVGVRRPMGGRLNLSLFLSLNQYVLMKSASITQIRLDNGRWPGAGLEMEYLLFRIRSVQLLLALGGGAAIPLDNSGYGIDLGAYGRSMLTFSIKRFGFMIGPYARLQTVSSSIITQYYAEIGATLLVGITFGKQKGRYMFSFSPRK